LCAILSVLPITSKSLTGAIKTSLWCILMPFVVAIVLALIGDSDAFFKTYSGGIVQNLESLIQLLVMTIILLLTPLITSKIMTDTGVTSVAENVGQMAAMSTMIGGASMASKFIGSKSQMIGGAIHNSASRPLMNKIKGAVSNRASEISQSKGIGPTLNNLTSEGGGIKSKFSEIREGMKRTSISEKAVLGADAVLNSKENSLAKFARNQEAQNLKNYQYSKVPEDKSYTAKAASFEREAVVPLGDYKKEAREYLVQRTNRNSVANKLKKNPEASHFIKSRTPHVLNLTSQQRQVGENHGFVLERNKLKAKEKVAFKKPFINRTGLRPQVGI